VKYQLKYDNIGNYTAENVILRDSLPIDVCFVVGSIALSGRHTIEYSIDKGMTW
jgi:uncharacterized repeat protein (TIGR01451 family)